MLNPVAIETQAIQVNDKRERSWGIANACAAAHDGCSLAHTAQSDCSTAQSAESSARGRQPKQACQCSGLFLVKTDRPKVTIFKSVPTVGTQFCSRHSWGCIECHSDTRRRSLSGSGRSVLDPSTLKKGEVEPSRSNQAHH